MTTTAAASSPTFPSSVSSTTSTFDNDVTELTHSLQEIRVNQGLCPQCGTRLYELESKRTGWVRRITKHQRKPIDVPGLVMRGQCLKCTTVLAGGGNDDTMAGISSTEASDHAYAMALASLEEEVEQAPPAATSASSSNNNHNSPSTTTTTATTTIAMALSSPHATYEGSYNDFGQSHGEGVLTWSNGDMYRGSFWNGQRHGEGTLQFAATTCHNNNNNNNNNMSSDSADGEYVGLWRHNLMHGSGTRRFANGDVYTGHYVNGKRSGDGRCYFANGDMYVGKWDCDEMNGFGRYYYNLGQCYEGFFHNGRRHGSGKYQLTDGSVDIYKYVDDMRVGEGVRWSANRKKAWRLMDGKLKGRVTLVEAAEIARRCEL